jgi:hypothetical protein
MTAEENLLRALNERGVRFVVIGVWGANLYATDAMQTFATRDKDFFLPADAENLLLAWRACESVGLELLCGSEPLDRPRDSLVAEAVVRRRAVTRATDGSELFVDLALTMSGFDFSSVWAERRGFRIHGVDVSVARLTHIALSKAAAGRPKDRLFLEAHREVLEDLIRRHEGTAS